LMRQPVSSRTARVSIHVASDPCFGSVRPKARRTMPSSIPGSSVFFCSSVPKSRIISTCGKLPTTEVSFQIVVQAESFGGEMLSNDGHGEVADVLAAIFFRQCESQEARFVRAPPHFPRQRFPVLPRQ